VDVIVCSAPSFSPLRAMPVRASQSLAPQQHDPLVGAVAEPWLLSIPRP
jgi:hypothetical protein